MAVAWFTEGSAGKPEVRWALSRDSGATFAAPRTVDADAPLGRTDVAFLDDGSVVVLWVARAEEDARAELRIRRYPESGEPDAAVLVTRVAAARASGFPRLAAAGGRLVVAWTDTAGPGLGVALVDLAR